MAADVVTLLEIGQGIDEPEELRLEGRAGHRPVHHPVAPPRHAEDLGALAVAELGDAAGEDLRVALDPGRIHGPDRTLRPLPSDSHSECPSARSARSTS